MEKKFKQHNKCLYMWHEYWWWKLLSARKKKQLNIDCDRLINVNMLIEYHIEIDIWIFAIK